MSIISLNLIEPSKNSFYFPPLTILLILFIVIRIIRKFQKEKKELNIFENEFEGEFDSFRLKKSLDSLRNRYIIYVFASCPLLTIFPYLYILFLTVHNFSRGEIAILYLVEILSQIFISPLLIKLSDKCGRKKILNLINFSIILNLFLRIKGSRLLIYLSQILSGLALGSFFTISQNWLNYEISRMFEGDNKIGGKFSKKLMKKSRTLNEIFSSIISIICAIFYSIFGINSPFWINIIINLIGIFCIYILWDENISFPDNNEESEFTNIKESFIELKKPSILLLSLIEGIMITVFNVFLFSWTPILKETISGYINIGFIFILMDLTKNIIFPFYQILNINFDIDNYFSISGCLFIEGLFFYFIYFHNSFLWRMIYFCIIYRFIKLSLSLRSILISTIFEEKSKIILLNLFNIPFSFVFISFIYINTFSIAKIAGSLTILSFILSVCLIVYTRIHKEEKNKYQKNEHETNEYQRLLNENE